VETLAAVAEGTGQWEVALRASEEAAERAGGDRVRSLVRASIAAYLAGKPEEGEALFERAKGIEPDHPSVLFREARLAEDGETRLSILERVEPANDSQRASLHAERAEAFGMLGRYDEAERDVAEGKEIGVDLFGLTRWKLS
jgi:tetratricopeptide (TPR) repeat protein